MMANFSVKDRVVYVSDEEYVHLKGKEGVVLYVKSSGSILVEFVEHMNGHDGNSGAVHGKDGHCWWCPAYCLRHDTCPESEVG